MQVLLGQYIDAELARIENLWKARWSALVEQVSALDQKLDKGFGEAAALSASQHEANQAQFHQILALLQAQGQVGTGPNQVAHDTVLALAKRLRPDELLDFDRAVKELEVAVKVALEVKAQGVQTEHGDHFVEHVLQRVAELTADGHLEQSADSINEALAELDRREAEQRHAERQRRSTLLEAAVRQGVLLREAGRVAAAVTGLAALSEPASPAASAAFWNRFKQFYAEGHDKGVNFSLEVAIALARLRLEVASTPDSKGESLNWLGNALSILGEQEIGTARLQEAVRAYDTALQEYTHERVPLRWALTKNNLGNALLTLGERESSTARLKEAVQAFQAALLEYDRERVPRLWAKAQNNLGNALRVLGECESNTARLEEAEHIHRAVLWEHTRKRVPMDWANTQNSLGAALQSLGERQSGTARLEEAVQAYSAALLERTRERAPLRWAATQNNLGKALQKLGERESGTARLEEAVEAYRAALQERTRERVSLYWATTQNNLGSALRALGERENSTARLEEAVEAYQAALQEYTREHTPHQWELVQNNLAEALQLLADRRA